MVRGQLTVQVGELTCHGGEKASPHMRMVRWLCECGSAVSADADNEEEKKILSEWFDAHETHHARADTTSAIDRLRPRSESTDE